MEDLSTWVDHCRPIVPENVINSFGETFLIRLNCVSLAFIIISGRVFRIKDARLAEKNTRKGR